MATLFLSCPTADKTLAKALERRLKSRGHTFKLAYGVLPAGNWRERLLLNLQDADAVVILLTQRALASPYVLGEVGMARANNKSSGQLILPVVVGLKEIPDFISDVTCFWLPTTGDSELDDLADQLEDAIADNAAARKQGPRIFISHRHKDENVVGALVAMLESAFRIEKEDIRCTSLLPYALPIGERVSERLRADLNGAELVMGVIGPDTSESRYVLFELGSAWGRGVPTFPLLIEGASLKDVPGPLSERHSVSLTEVENCLELTDNIGKETTLDKRQGVSGRIAAAAQRLATLAGQKQAPPGGTVQPPATTGTGTQANSTTEDIRKAGLHITNYLNALGKRMVSFEKVREKINSTYSDSFLLDLIDRTPERFRRATLKGNKRGIAIL
jgi:hypothetical protein